MFYFKRLFRELLFIIAVSSCAQISAQTIKKYPELKNVIYCPDNFCKTNDNGFAIVGLSASNNVYMVKLNSEYEIKWHRQVYARPRQTTSINIFQDNEGFFYIGGTTHSDDDYDNLVWYIIKLDNSGNLIKEIVWQAEGNQSSILVDFILLEDGLMAGYRARFEDIENNDYLSCLYTAFLNNELEMVSEKQRRKWYFSKEQIRFPSSFCSDKTGFLFAGPYGFRDPWKSLWFLKIENDAVAWEKTLSDSSLSYFNHQINQAVSIGYLMGGFASNSGNPAMALIDSKMENLYWFKEFEYNSDSLVYFPGRIKKFWEINKNEYIVVFNSNSLYTTATTFVVKIDCDGKIQWQQKADGTTLDAVYLSATNNNVVCVGYDREQIPQLIEFQITNSTITISEPALVNPKVKLFQNYPNPFNPSTTIRLNLPCDSHVKLIVYDLGGHEVATLINENKLAGYYFVTWNPARDIPNGIYIYQLIANQKMICKKMIFQK